MQSIKMLIMSDVDLMSTMFSEVLIFTNGANCYFYFCYISATHILWEVLLKYPGGSIAEISWGKYC